MDIEEGNCSSLPYAMLTAFNITASHHVCNYTIQGYIFFELLRGVDIINTMHSNFVHTHMHIYRHGNSTQTKIELN